jgi:hypothetical protein
VPKIGKHITRCGGKELGVPLAQVESVSLLAYADFGEENSVHR